MRRVLFVTRELYPFSAGGIGRVVANMLVRGVEAGVQFTVLYIGSGPDDAAFAAVYPGVGYLCIGEQDYVTSDEEGRVYPDLAVFNDSLLHAESTLALQGIRRLVKAHGTFDYIEFVDWGASGFCATQEKRLGKEFASTILAVRLHTTDSILMDYEGRSRDLHALCLHDLERKALADCDVVVAQLQPVADAFKAFYGFETDDWAPRVIVHSPPVELDHVPLANATIVPGPNTTLVFSSKLQEIKRPAQFVQAAAEVMLLSDEYRGNVHFVAHAFDPAFREMIEREIPDSLRDRFVFLPSLAPRAREAQIAGSICVFPSPWESYCLAAYEASLSGAFCIVNGGNPAFGDGTPWIHGRNCLKFDGTSGSLARVIEHALVARPQLVPVSVPDTRFPWHQLPARVATATVDNTVAAIIVTRNQSSALLDTVERLLTADAAVDHVVVVDDGSTAPTALATLQRLEDAFDGMLRVVRLPLRSGLPRSLNEGFRHVEADVILVARAGDYMAPAFLSKVRHAFDSDPQVTVVSSQYARASADAADGCKSAMAAFAVAVIGDCRASGFHDNRFAASTYAFRRSHADGIRWNESLPRLCHWQFLRDLSGARRRFVVSSEVEVALHPGDDLLPLAATATTLAREAELMLRHRAIAVGDVRVPLYSFGTGVGVTGYSMWLHMTESGKPAAPGLMAPSQDDLSNSETVRVALAVARRVERYAPWALRTLKRAFHHVQALRSKSK